MEAGRFLEKPPGAEREVAPLWDSAASMTLVPRDESAAYDPDSNGWTGLADRGAQLYYDKDNNTVSDNNGSGAAAGKSEVEEAQPSRAAQLEQRLLLGVLAQLATMENEAASAKSPFGALPHIPSIARCVDALEKATTAKQYPEIIAAEILKLKAPGRPLDHALAIEFVRQILNKVSFDDDEQKDQKTKQSLFSTMQAKYVFWNHAPESQENIIRAYCVQYPDEAKHLRAVNAPTGKDDEGQLQYAMPVDVRSQIAWHMIPDKFKVQYLSEVVAQDQLEAVLKAMGIKLDLAAEYAAIEQLIPKSVGRVIFPDGKNAEYYFNSYHGDTRAKQLASILETCGLYPTEMLAKSAESDHGLPIAFVTQRFVDVTEDWAGYIADGTANGRARYEAKGWYDQRILAYSTLLLLPKTIRAFTSLESLDLNGNRLYALPREIGALSKLKTLSLAHNYSGACRFSPAFGELQALEDLSLICNHLKAIPAEIGKLPNIVHLDIRANRLARNYRLPPGLEKFASQLNAQGDYYFEPTY